jgi:hypothetical protein
MTTRQVYRSAPVLVATNSVKDNGPEVYGVGMVGFQETFR